MITRQESRTAAILTLVALGLPASVSAQEASITTRVLTEADYARAERFLPQNLAGRIKNIKVTPNWIGNDDQFWYRRDTAEGTEFVVVEAKSGKKKPAFDHERVAAGLSELLGEEVRPRALPFTTFTFSADGRSISFTHGTSLVTCGVKDGRCSQSHLPAADRTALVSPDGSKAVFRKDYNLWIRDLETGNERPLTRDGARFFSYGAMPDANLMNITQKRTGLTLPPVGVLWGPDSRTLIAQRLDERELREYYYWEPAPADGSFRPIVHPIRMRLAGEPEKSRADLFIIEVESGAQTLIRLPGDRDDPNALGIDPSSVYWTRDASTAFFTAQNGSSARAALMAVDLHTGIARVVFEESSSTFLDFGQWIYSRSNVMVVSDGAEAIWYSERDGWGHLYLYDVATGALKNQITRGEWVVWNVLHVDERDRRIYFTAGGREPGRHPYYRHLYRVDFDGGNLTLLTPEDADHELSAPPVSTFSVIFGVPTEAPFSPSGKFLVETYSTVSEPPVSVVRKAQDGSVVAVLERADISGLEEIDWKPPEIVTAKAADGTTDMYGVLYTPIDFDPSRSYPVVEHIYAGPQTKAVPNFFAEGIFGGFAAGNQSLAELGFAVVVVDGPGTPGRSKPFHDMPYGKLDRWGIEHHVVAIKEIARSRPYLDLDRVGVTGHSFGGYGSAMAILLHGDFYKVAVSTAGSYDWPAMYSGFPKYLGMPDYEYGRTTQSSPTDRPGYLWKTSASANAHRLNGRLLLGVGDLDENAPPAAAFQFIDALVDAGKSFDFLFLPGRTHYFTSELYFLKRRWNYFVEHLLGAEPLIHYELKAPEVRPPRILR